MMIRQFRILKIWRHGKLDLAKRMSWVNYMRDTFLAQQREIQKHRMWAIKFMEDHDKQYGEESFREWYEKTFGRIDEKIKTDK